MSAEVATGSLRLNPLLKVRRMVPDSSELLIDSPVKGAELKRLHVSRQRDAELFEGVVGAIAQLHRGSPVAALPVSLLETLRTWGILVEPACAPDRVLLRCELPSPLPSEEVPSQLRSERLASWARVLPRGQTPEGVAAPWSALEPANQLLWVRARVAPIWLPYWTDSAEVARIEAASARDAALGDLPQELVARLARASEWHRPPLASEVHGYRSRRFAELNRLVPLPWVEAWRRFYDAAIAEGHFGRDRSELNQFCRHDEPLASMLQGQLTSLVSQLWGEQVRPSYTYSVKYAGGAVLERHTDREQCHHTISLLLGYAPEPQPEEQSPWALRVIEPDSERELQFHQRRGDGLLFRGRELPHYRERLPSEHTSTSVFLHYVPHDFSGSLK